jgi:hypothetical protein
MTPHGRSFRRRAAAAMTAVLAWHLVAAAPARADVPGVGVVTDAVGGLVGGAAGFAFDNVAEGIARWVLGAVGFFVNGVLDYLRSTARPDVEAVWFAGPESPYATVRNLAAVLLVAFVFLGILQGLLHGDTWGMVRRAAGNLPAAVAGMVVTTMIVGRLVELTDALSNAVLANGDSQALHFLSGFGVTVTSVSGGFAAVILGLVAVVAALLLWIELLVRSALIYLLVAISPLGFAATLWPSARGFLRKTLEILLAVIVSKFVICVALAIGIAALAGAGQAGNGQSVAGSAGANVGTLLSGAVLLGLAAFSPFLVMKLVPLAEGALLAQGISHGPARAAQSGLSTYSSVQMASRLSGSGSHPGSAPAAWGAAGGGAGGTTERATAASGPAGGSAATGGATGAAGGAAVVTAAKAAGRVEQSARRATATTTKAADPPPTAGREPT